MCLKKTSPISSLTALIANAAADPNPTREFMLGEPCLNALRPSKSISEQELHLPQSEKELIKYLKNTVQDHAGKRFQFELAICF